MRDLAKNLDEEDIKHDTDDDPNCDDGPSVDEQQPAFEEFVQEDQVRNAHARATDDEGQDGPDSDPLLAERRRDRQHTAEADVNRRTGQRRQRDS